MDVTVTVNFWFMISICLAFILIGMVIGVRMARGRNDHYRY